MFLQGVGFLDLNISGITIDFIYRNNCSVFSSMFFHLRGDVKKFTLGFAGIR